MREQWAKTSVAASASPWPPKAAPATRPAGPRALHHYRPMCGVVVLEVKWEQRVEEPLHAPEVGTEATHRYSQKKIG